MLVAVAASGAAATETELTVMSYNILNGGARLGEENAWSHRKEMVVGAIKQCDPDILGVQECFDYQAEFLAKSLPKYHWIGVGRDADGGGEMAAIFYRKGLLSPIETGNFWLSETPDVPGSQSWETRCTRMATWARFHHRKTGAAFLYCNTHFDHGSEEARVGGAKLLAARALQIAGDLPIIVTGDFNAQGGDSAPWRILSESGFVDARLVAAKREGPDTTFCDFNPPPTDGQSRIDWILFRGTVTVDLHETVTYQDHARYPSDHLPVLAKLRF